MTPSASAPAPAAKPPQNFVLAQLRVQMTRQSGHGIAPTKRVTLNGLSGGTLETGTRSQPFSYTAEELMVHVNALYRMQFFDLPSRYNTHPSVFLRPDGTVGQMVMRAMDTQSTELCFALPDYKKCVLYDNLQVPADLDALVMRLIAQAEQKAGP